MAKKNLLGIILLTKYRNVDHRKYVNFLLLKQCSNIGKFKSYIISFVKAV